MTSPAEHAATVREALPEAWETMPYEAAANPFRALDALLALAARADELEHGPCRCDKCRDCVAADGYEKALALLADAKDALAWPNGVLSPEHAALLARIEELEGRL